MCAFRTYKMHIRGYHVWIHMDCAYMHPKCTHMWMSHIWNARNGYLYGYRCVMSGYRMHVVDIPMDMHSSLWISRGCTSDWPWRNLAIRPQSEESDWKKWKEINQIQRKIYSKKWGIKNSCSVKSGGVGVEGMMTSSKDWALVWDWRIGQHVQHVCLYRCHHHNWRCHRLLLVVEAQFGFLRGGPSYERLPAFARQSEQWISLGIPTHDAADAVGPPMDVHSSLWYGYVSTHPYAYRCVTSGYPYGHLTWHGTWYP